MALYKKKQENLAHIPLYYIEKDINGMIKAFPLEDKVAKEMLEKEETKDKVQILNTYWKSLSWAQNREINKACQVKNENNFFVGEIDFISVQDLRFKNCLVKWDLKDEEERAVPVSVEVINSLDSDIMNALYQKYLILMNPSEDELKN